MFKTVRAQHGAGDVAAELEYTILPQTDDRSSGSSGDDEPCAADGRRRCGHRADFGDSNRRTVIIIVAMLVLGCGVVAAAVLVPILLAARLVSMPTSARLQTFAVAASGVVHSARGDYVQLLPVKHAAPGTVIEFDRLAPPQLPQIPPSHRARRSVAALTAKRRRKWPDNNHFQRSGANFRSLDFRIP
ncbi:uncharacterized protein LOC126903911 [Daktulosphaira vitifoliae]|uniref:uncharacterized protein LOC126903911 n=1 Tax=Daktulosphaira vitifoliae TaxID=58002 RepID=UPI0021AA281C|nr:uncharacterized protein LOC126903911 [Daktulosphaira vitifoliae]